METARRSDVFSRIVVYEPGVPIAGSIRLEWIPTYRRLLAAGDTRGAFATLVRGSGHAPRALSVLPLWYTRLALRLAIRGRRWQQIEPLLAANLAEHEQIGHLEQGAEERYGSIRANVLLLGGTKSPPFAVRELLPRLNQMIPGSTLEILPGLTTRHPSGRPQRLPSR